MIVVETECEPEHCEVDYFLMTGTSGPKRLPFDVDGPWVFSPNRRYLYFGSTGMGFDDEKGTPTGKYEAFLARLDVTTMQSAPVASCASPVLSPSKKWVVCRDAAGHVYRMPVRGGALELIHRVNLGKNIIYIDAHIGVSLHPVVFLDAKRMQVKTPMRDAGFKTDVVKWRE